MKFLEQPKGSRGGGRAPREPRSFPVFFFQSRLFRVLEKVFPTRSKLFFKQKRKFVPNLNFGARRSFLMRMEVSPKPFALQIKFLSVITQILERLLGYFPGSIRVFGSLGDYHGDIVELASLSTPSHLSELWRFRRAFGLPPGYPQRSMKAAAAPSSCHPVSQAAGLLLGFLPCPSVNGLGKALD